MTFLWLVWHNSAGAKTRLSLNWAEAEGPGVAVPAAGVVLPYCREASDRQALQHGRASESP